MHILYDNLLATFIATTLILMLITSNTRHRRVLTEATVFYATTTQTENFLQILRRDMNGITRVYDVKEDSTDLTFSFQTRIANGATLRDVTYRRELVTERDSTKFYRMVRLVDGVEVGGSGDILVDWYIEARNEQGQVINDPADLGNCRQIYVRLDTALPLAPLETVKRLHWESTFYPPLLSQNQLF